jgi:hypothetical protein
VTSHTTLHIDCNPIDKQRWMLSASASGIKLGQWVTEALNAAAINTEWAAGLSERTIRCLLISGLSDREAVTAALENPEYNWQAIQNFAPRCKREIEEWIKND